MIEAPETRPKTVTDMVREDYRTAAVFKRYAINYCCGGKWPVEMMCENAGVDHRDILREIELETRFLQPVFLRSVFKWSTGFLIEYIREVYHPYLEAQLPHILSEIENFAEGHRKKFKFLEELEPLVSELGKSVTAYLEQDRKLYAEISADPASSGNYQLAFDDKKTHLVSVLRLMRSVSNEYIFHETACTSHRVAFSLLKELETWILDLVYLEEILFERLNNQPVK